MSTHSGRAYNATQLTQQQQDEMLLNLVNQIGELSKKVDTMWNHHVERPRGSGEKKNGEEAEGEEPIGGDDMRQRFNAAYHDSDYAPRYPNNTGPCFYKGEKNPYFEGYTNQVDEAIKRVRIEVLDFHGKLDPYAFQDWLTSLEVEWFRLAPARQVRFMKMKLKGQARVWWQIVEEHLHHLHQPPITDWGELKLKLQEKYIPVDYEEVLFEELLLLRQGHLSVEEFTNKFHELSICCRVSETDHQTIARYKAGLWEDIKKELLTIRLVSIEEAYQLAL